MAGSKLKIDIRRNRILEQLRQRGRVNVLELSQLLGTTAVTIRNDLTALERDGYLLRTQGGAVQIPRAEEEPGINFPGKSENGEEKQRIAEAVAAMIRDGDTLFINSGTTTQMVASALQVRTNLNIVTKPSSEILFDICSRYYKTEFCNIIFISFYSVCKQSTNCNIKQIVKICFCYICKRVRVNTNYPCKIFCISRVIVFCSNIF